MLKPDPQKANQYNERVLTRSENVQVSAQPHDLLTLVLNQFR